MKVELPSGETAELRDKLKAKDKFAVQGAITVMTNAQGQMSGQVSGNIMTLMETALMARLLESWSLDAPLPGSHACSGCTGDSSLWHQHVADYIGDMLDLDDFNELESVITPLLDRVMSAPNRVPSSG